MTQYFKYELTVDSISNITIQRNFMCKTVKVQLATDSIDPFDCQNEVMHALDGGALLHRVRKG